MHVDARYLPDGAYAWRWLAVSLAIATIGGVGLWSAVVALPVIQAEFGLDRGGASIPTPRRWSASPWAEWAWDGSPTASASACR